MLQADILMTLFALVGVDRGQLLFAAFHRTSPLLIYLRIVAGITRLYGEQGLSVQHPNDREFLILAQPAGLVSASTHLAKARRNSKLGVFQLGDMNSLTDVHFGLDKSTAIQLQTNGKLTLVVCSSNFSFGSSFSLIVIRRAQRGQTIVVRSFPRAFSQKCEA